MKVIENWLESLAASMTDEEINAAIEAHLTDYDEAGNIAYQPSEADINKVRTDSYAALRRGAYGSWQEQLDRQYAGTWEAHVEHVKERFAK